MENQIQNTKQQIIDIFVKNVKGKPIIVNKQHCGGEGHWLEKKMGIKPNNKNEPDLLGYEMKKFSKKITFGDFSATEYLFSKEKSNINSTNNWNNQTNEITRNQFIHYFGTPKAQKGNRYSWSGACVPTYNVWNNCGQMLTISENNDICIYYSYEKDERETKNTLPEFLKNNNILIVIWKREKMEQHINKKFNKNGLFICEKINNKYEKIHFGKPFNFEYFINNIKNKNIIFDSGLYEGNNRNYSQFRSTTSNFWNLLVDEII